MRNVLLLTLFFALAYSTYSQTSVSGGIYTNTTWAKANSPYIVTDTVVVFPGVTLTIEPGVVVRFDNSMQLEVRDGSLIANGTAMDSITFTSNTSNTPGSWASVWLHSTTNTDSSIYRLNYCNFRYATKGVRYGQGSARDSLFVKNSNFSFNKTGLDGGRGQSFYMDTCSFISNVDYGLYTVSGKVNYCNFLHTQNTGLSSGNNCVIRKCSAKYNRVGIYAGAMDSIVDCYAALNATGIAVYSPAIVRNCISDSNSVSGIDVSTDCLLAGNQIKYNAIGIRASSFSTFLTNLVTENIIEYDSIGIYLGVANLNITCNKICNNTFYNLQHGRNFGSNSNISNNYWCTTDSALIASKIYDGYDNINFGLVSFIPVDTTQCYLTGCNLSITSTITNATCDTCRNGSAMAAVAFGSLPLTYTWNSSPLQTTQIATNLAPGNYTICVIDAIGCTACSTVFIDSSNCGGFSVAAQATNATCNACSDGSAQVNVTGGAPPYSYTWYTSPIQTSATAVGMSQGTYSVCVNDLHGCAVCDTVTISIGNCSAHFNLYPDSVPHNYTAVNMASGNGPLTYLWSWGDGATDTGPYPRHTYASAGFYAICLSITDSVGCTNSYCNNFYLQRNTNAMVNVNVIPGISTDISAIRNPQSSFLLSPNPANSSVTISIDESMIGGTVTVMDLMGRKMLAVQLVTGNQQLATDNLSSGVYFVEVVSKGGRVVKQLMKQ